MSPKMSALGLGIGIFAFIAMSGSEAKHADFALDFYSATSAGKENENVIVSPISIKIALAMLYAGARSTTRTQLAKPLGIARDFDFEEYAYTIAALKDPVLKIASAVFVDNALPLESSYKTNVVRVFSADIQQVDFSKAQEAAGVINNWCAANTNNKIKEIFKADDLSSNTKAVLANAVHFKAKWKYQFDPKSTRKLDFFAPGGKIQVDMMHTEKKFMYTDSADIQAQVLELPYDGDKFRMVVILPYENTPLTAVVEKLKKTPLEKVLNKMHNTTVSVFLPKFKIEMEMDLNEALKKMGITEIFSDQADLSGISTAPLKVSKVKQKVFIDVNEEGTEAAAVTGMKVVLLSARVEEEITFLADRPFLIYILPKNTTTNIFAGSIFNV